MATADEYAAWIVKNADKKGTPDFEVVAKAYQDAKATPASKPFGQQLNEGIADIPRQVGLTARHGIEGVGNVVDMVASPFRAAVNTVLPDKYAAQPGIGGKVADAIGLPKPANATERIVGDATQMMAGGGGTLGLASKVAKATTGTTQAVSKLAAANPGQQITSAAASGGAGGYTRETGGNEGSQLLASLSAGITSPLIMNKVQNLGQSAVNTVRRIATPAPAQNPQIDIHIDHALQNSGLTMADLPVNIQNGIRQDVQAALQTNGNLSPDAIRRLADYRLTNTTPTAATLTLDPAMVSQQKNLAKQGINSKDRAAHELGQVENANNRQLITGLNDLGANTPDSTLAGGQKVIKALGERDAAAKSLIKGRYDAAKATNGRSAALDPSAFTTQADELLTKNLRNSALPADVRKQLNDFADGSAPLTVDTAEQFKTTIGKIHRTSQDGAEREALSYVRQALDDTPLLDGQGQQAIDAFNKARRLNRAYMGIVEKTPALQAVRDGIEPDKFVQQFIVGGGAKANLADLNALKRSVKSNPEAMTAIKEQITSHLKKSALNGAADEVGNFSQSAYNKALGAIGDQKLGMFFSKEELTQLRAIGRVASYEQFQPKGSAINNSNTAGTAISNILDRIGGSSLLSKIPLGNMLAGPAQNISVGIRSNQALDVPRSLGGLAMLPAPKQPSALLLSPAAFMTNDDRNKNSLSSGR